MRNCTIRVAKTKALISFAVTTKLTAKLICAFQFATRIVQFLIYLTPKFSPMQIVSFPMGRLIYVGSVYNWESYFLTFDLASRISICQLSYKALSL